ncbi:MAG: hypothetical protein FRX48_05125 [Lasallia pustulata]|uniref:Uncharacterized protein n=1 Tax=Lasallia pustulata TaxID=136370 RepID=A0A5M8PMX9_9LECA|nr:MAG: hypothetical protein FRX48_05125 [Lasallia pustulata]
MTEVLCSHCSKRAGSSSVGLQHAQLAFKSRQEKLLLAAARACRSPLLGVACSERDCSDPPAQGKQRPAATASVVAGAHVSAVRVRGYLIARPAQQIDASSAA